MSGHHGTSLNLAGEQTIRNVAQAAEQLGAAMTGDGPLVVDCSGATTVDVAFVQVLLAARKAALDAGRTLRLRSPAGGALRACLTAGGFLPAAPGVVRGTFDFWMAEEAE